MFDLRDQSRSREVHATTRDGIPIATSVTVVFHVRRLAPGQRRPRSVEMDTIPYPYDRSALFHLTYAGSVTGDDIRLSWADQMLSLIHISCAWCSFALVLVRNRCGNG